MTNRITSEATPVDENGSFTLTARTEPGVDTEFVLVQKILTPIAFIKAYGLQDECKIF